MDAARELFARHGFGATLDEVATFAGLGIGTVYRHFPNKSAVINALFEESVDRLVDLARAAAEAEDAWEGFVGFLVDTACEPRGRSCAAAAASAGKSPSGAT